MHRRTAMLVAGMCAGAMVATLGVAAAVRPPGPAAVGPLPATPPTLTTSVATTATAAPPETPAKKTPAPSPAGPGRAHLAPGKPGALVRDRETFSTTLPPRPGGPPSGR